MELAEFIKGKVQYLHNPLPYDLFSEVVASAIPAFKFVSNEEASKEVVKALAAMGIEVGSQEVNLHRKWPAQEHVVPLGNGNPGGLYNPRSSLHVGDYVSVDKDTWRPAFDGVVEKVNKDSADIRDPETLDVQEAIPLKLVKKRLAKGRPIAPPQHKRIGDPLGFMESPLPAGDPNSTRVYPGMAFVPKGHEGDSGCSYPDLFYSSLITDIDEKHGKISLIVAKYLLGEAVNPSRELVSILEAYGIMRAV